MKKMITCLLAAVGLAPACAQQNFEDANAKEFAELATKSDVVTVDVRTAEEFAVDHIVGAINIDMKKRDFMDQIKSAVPADKTVAVYCRSGRRSHEAAIRLTFAGYKCVNLAGGILAWKEAGLPVTPGTFETDTFQTKSGKELKIHALMHASIRMEYDGKEIEIDPVRVLGGRAVDYALMPKADYLLVTHEHQDHFDKEAIAMLSGEATRVITNKRCAEMLGKGETMANGDKMQIGSDITIEAVPAYNTTAEHLQFHPKGRDNGFVLTIDGLRIYIAGDTEDIPEMSEIKDIDIAFLPCNQPYTMTVDQLVNAAKMVKPKVLFPYHYGKTPAPLIAKKLRGSGINVRIRQYQ